MCAFHPTLPTTAGGKSSHRVSSNKRVGPRVHHAVTGGGEWPRTQTLRPGKTSGKPWWSSTLTKSYILLGDKHLGLVQAQHQGVEELLPTLEFLTNY